MKGKWYIVRLENESGISFSTEKQALESAESMTKNSGRPHLVYVSIAHVEPQTKVTKFDGE